MRWQPAVPVCEECGFDWNGSASGAVEDVTAAPATVAVALSAVSDPYRRVNGRWSAAMYVWHLVDALRVGTERLLTVALEPDWGLVCWDEQSLAEARRYEQLSPAVGLVVLERAARDWAEAAAVVPQEVLVQHPVLGTVTAADLVRRDAHEMHHHVWDIAGSEPSH